MTSVPDHADAVVAGGGVIGASIAYYLVRHGLSVVVLERDRIGSGASSANPGTISLATKKPGPSLRLALASGTLFETLQAELGEEIEYERCGTLVVAENEDELGFLEQLVVGQQLQGAPVRMVDSAETIGLCPLLEGGQVAGGSFCSADAQVNPFKLTYAFMMAASARGAEFVDGCRVLDVNVESGHVRGVRTELGTIKTTWLINAAGCWSPDIGRMVGVDHRVTPKRGQLMALAVPDAVPMIKVSAARQLRAKHASDAESSRPSALTFSYTYKPHSGTVLLGNTSEDAGFDLAVTTEALRWIASYAARLMPALGRYNVLRAWAGLRPHHEGGPIIGSGGGPGGYLVATGHGGDGVALSPVTGSMVAAMVTNGEAGTSIEEVLARIGVDAPVPYRGTAALST